MSCQTNERLDPRVQRTRLLLQEAMRSLMREKSFGDVSVQDVTARATVNRATFYAHYPDKHALLASILTSDFQSILKERITEFCHFTPEKLREVVSVVVEFIGEKYLACPKHVQESEHILGTTMQEELHDLFRHWLERDTPEVFRDYPPEMVATVLSWGIYGASLRWSKGKRKRTPAEVADSIVALLMPAVPIAA